MRRTRSVWVPTGTRARTYPPSARVQVPIEVWSTETWAPTTGAPSSSTTLPPIVPVGVACCAIVIDARARNIESIHATTRAMRPRESRREECDLIRGSSILDGAGGLTVIRRCETQRAGLLRSGGLIY